MSIGHKLSHCRRLIPTNHYCLRSGRTQPFHRMPPVEIGCSYVFIIIFVFSLLLPSSVSIVGVYWRGGEKGGLNCLALKDVFSSPPYRRLLFSLNWPLHHWRLNQSLDFWDSCPYCYSILVYGVENRLIIFFILHIRS